MKWGYIMTTKKDILIRLATTVMALAYIVPFHGSAHFIGEPLLPSKMQK